MRLCKLVSFDVIGANKHVYHMIKVGNEVINVMEVHLKVQFDE